MHFIHIILTKLHYCGAHVLHVILYKESPNLRAFGIPCLSVAPDRIHTQEEQNTDVTKHLCCGKFYVA